VVGPDGYVAGFQLRVESATVLDNTATNNIRIVCRYLDGSEKIVEADSLIYGSWRNTPKCEPIQYVCAIRTQIEPYQGDGGITLTIT